MTLLFPAYNPNDTAAISAVLASLVANEEPPRVDVSCVQDSDGREEAWLNRPPYPNGRLLIRGKCRAGIGEVTGFHVAYCCARFGRQVPVAIWALTVGEGTPELRDAPFDEFSCINPNPPHSINSDGDGWREIFDTALAALS